MVMNISNIGFVSAGVAASVVIAAMCIWANRPLPSAPPPAPLLSSVHEDESPLHGHSPIYTVIPLPLCTNYLQLCDQWEYCGEGAKPRMSMPAPPKLWNTHVVAGK